jgi:Uma2 family endonuclease
MPKRIGRERKILVLLEWSAYFCNTQREIARAQTQCTMEVLSKKMTYADLQDLEILEGDTGIYELLNGEIVRRSSPNTPHQRTSANLFLQFGMYNLQKKVGQFFFAPYDVYLDENNAGIQPDILFVSHERDFVIRENNGVVGAPDLVVEILSKGTVGKDRGDKKDIYEQFAVREYWIVDPQARSIEIYSMEDSRYRLHAFAAEEGTVTSRILPDLTLDVSTIF